MAGRIRRWCWRNSEDRWCQRPTSTMSACCLTRSWAILRLSSPGPSPGRRSSRSLSVWMRWKSGDAPLGNCRSHRDPVHAREAAAPCPRFRADEVLAWDAIAEVIEIPCMPVRPLHLVRAVAPTRCSLGMRHGWAITEVVEIPCMPVRPLHLIRAIAPMRCSLGRRHGGLLLGCLRLLSLKAMEGFYWDTCGSYTREAP